jgi:hypothetical protein
LNFSDYLIRNGRPANWKQAGSDFVCAVSDSGGDVAAALRSLVDLGRSPLKITRVRRGADGDAQATEFLEVGQRELEEIVTGARHALAWREGYAAGLAARDGAPPSRPIGFH